jgi:NAD(P)H dehydrogenase (quinone)
MGHAVVVFHSGHGHTRQLAEAVAEGAGAVLLEIDANGQLPEAGWTRLEEADLIVMGSPTYMGGASWPFMRFADDSSLVWMAQKWKDKLFAGFTNSASMSGDKLSTLHYLFTLAMQHGGIWVGTGMMPSNTKAAERNDLNYIGSWSGAMASTPVDAGVDEMSPGDLETGRRFGERLRLVLDRWMRTEQAPAA